MTQRSMKLVRLTFAAAVLIGLLVDPDGPDRGNESELMWWVGVGFVFFLVSVLLSTLLEGGFWQFCNRLRGMERNGSSAKGFLSGNRRFFRIVVLLSCGLGLGLAASALWRGADYFWLGLAFMSCSAGMVLARNLGLQILGIRRNDHD